MMAVARTAVFIVSSNDEQAGQTAANGAWAGAPSRVLQSAINRPYLTST